MILKKELKVLVVIERMTEMGKVPYYTSIWNALQEVDDFSKSTLHNAIDHLIDMTAITASWEKVEENGRAVWVRQFKVGEYNIGFAKKIVQELW